MAQNNGLFVKMTVVKDNVTDTSGEIRVKFGRTQVFVILRDPSIILNTAPFNKPVQTSLILVVIILIYYPN